MQRENRPVHISKLQEHQHIRAQDKSHKGDELYLSVRFASYLKCGGIFQKKSPSVSAEADKRTCSPLFSTVMFK